jgi:hypothetical protein
MHPYRCKGEQTGVLVYGSGGVPDSHRGVRGRSGRGGRTAAAAIAQRPHGAPLPAAECGGVGPTPPAGRLPGGCGRGMGAHRGAIIAVYRVGRFSSSLMTIAFRLNHSSLSNCDAHKDRDGEREREGERERGRQTRRGEATGERVAAAEHTKNSSVIGCPGRTSGGNCAWNGHDTAWHS